MMHILGIETSCDETAVALYEADIATGNGRLLTESVHSQIAIHAKFGGVVPEIASREHLAVLPDMVADTLAKVTLNWHDISMIAVTAGPGLMGGLLVGVAYAQAAGLAHGIPVRPIHHMEGHLLAPGIDGELPPFPFITLLVSGGHTMLVRVNSIGNYHIIGQTLDDAAGECFDKSARVLGLPYPGGPEISALAQHGVPNSVALPRPMLNKPNVDFSFSGLKTAVMYAARDMDTNNTQQRADLAASTEAAICDVLAKKSMAACKQEGIKNLVIAGGVAANQRLRHLLASESNHADVHVCFPRLEHCTDNAAMIAYAGFVREYSGIVSTENWDAMPRWKLSGCRTLP